MKNNKTLEDWIADCERLSKENTYLKQQLTSLLQPNKSAENNGQDIVTRHSPLDAKIQLYRRLFNGRSDVYATRWESKDGRNGYLPACANEWDKSICQKPKIKCSECRHRKLLPLTNEVIEGHFKGKHSIGLYPLHEDGTCSFLAIDFDKQDWKKDVVAFVQICKQCKIPYSVERSRSGNGAHVWFFFNERLESSLARKLGYSLQTKTLEVRHEVGMKSFDRMFPNQDTVPIGGFGNLIALPLQRQAGLNGNSLFVDDNYTPFPDQWIYLSTIQRLSKSDVYQLIKQLDGYEANFGSMPSNTVYPKNITIEIKNGLYIKKKLVPSSLAEKLTELVSFQNPEYYKAKSKRLSTANIPRVVRCSYETSEHLIFPRGCKEELVSLLNELGINTTFEDSAYEGEPLEATFNGELTSQQVDAVSQLTQHDCGVLSATTGFGKTVAAAALIAERKVSTLIIVDKIQLQQQWINQLKAFLELGNDDVGEVGGGKKKVTGKIDVVTLQSLAHKGEVKSFITQYGQIIVDECHHISAYTFESVLKSVRAKYVYGLTATPIRKDGLHPIIFMQCGPVRYKVDARNQAKVRPFVHRLIVRKTNFKSKSEQIQELYRSLAKDQKRNQQLFDDVLLALEGGRSPIILTERIEHLEELQEIFRGFAKNIITLSGKLSKKERMLELKRLSSTPDSEERLVIATGKYIGEGFDDARLDTLFLAMPISWKGTLQQYVGRLHRLHENKQEVQVYDYVDNQVPMLKRMYEKRQSGYRLMGYVTDGESKNSTEQMQLF
ncbi:TOTE conflict system archaeo-eukaryotic primase domain-containing protein [Bacillus sp. CHD6a]|uniref:TOTE conflict system archaeo-eukaryotic primase domain-containing protein n=1 Tax=Bacillus sp. CHD6a TaxID=1643452 RepID=UPI0006CD0DAB|nr:DEAD/DEAH box helicase [Bacillus sp. CHD6a]KPB06039.1 restriction endonuclease subunit R [Bacillus sp. CHD6a]